MHRFGNEMKWVVALLLVVATHVEQQSLFIADAGSTFNMIVESHGMGVRNIHN